MKVNQRKGETEMAVMDWLYNFALDMSDGNAIMSIITSGDIDAVLIHLFAISNYWPRFENRTFRNQVYVKLTKTAGFSDLYNITGIIENCRSYLFC